MGNACAHSAVDSTVPKQQLNPTPKLGMLAQPHCNFPSREGTGQTQQGARLPCLVGVGMTCAFRSPDEQLLQQELGGVGMGAPREEARDVVHHLVVAEEVKEAIAPNDHELV